MKKQIISIGMSIVLAFSSVVSVFAIDEAMFNNIKGNSIVIGDYLFDLNTNGTDFTLDNFMKATRSITGQYNNVFYKSLTNKWFELVSDENMVDGITSATAMAYMPNKFTTIYGDLGTDGGSGNDQKDKGTILNLEQSQIVNIEQVHYGVLVIKNGNADDYNFKLGGQSFEPTMVSDNKKVVKFEVNPNEKAIVVVTSKTDPTITEEISMGSGADEFSNLIVGQAPEKVLANGAVSVFDYHLDNYDVLGNVRIHALKTTFDTENEGFVAPNETLPKLNAQKTSLGQDIILEATGNNVEHWLGNVYKVQKDYGTGWGSRVDVAFSITDSGIKVLANSTALADRNGKHNLVVLSKGFEEVRITIELVKPAGRLSLTGEFNWWANQDLLFELSDFNYAIINPIYEVELDGIVLRGNDDQYHVISNLVRLENNALPLLTIGRHTLIVRAEGYEDYKVTFNLEKALNGQQNPVYGNAVPKLSENNKVADLAVTPVATKTSVDGVTKASSGGSGSGSGSGGVMVNAYLIFDFDLVANARILTHLGMGTPYANEVLNWWRATSKEALFYADGSYKLVDYTYFKNNGAMASGGNKYITFRELYDSVTPYTGNMFDKQHPGLALNSPGNVKNVMEDGLLGSTIRFKEISALKAPTVTAQQSYYGEDIILNYSGSNLDEWLKNITLITLNTYSYVTNYTINKDEKTITIPSSNAITAGTNEIAINANGYATAKISVAIVKHNSSDLKATVNADGSVIISGMEVPYVNSITNIKVNGMTLFNDSQYGAGKGHYEIIGNTIVLRKKAFENNGEQVLTIYSSGYENNVLRFNNNNISTGEVPKADVPLNVVLDSSNSYTVNREVKIVTGTMLDTVYGQKITEVTVNDQPVENKYNGVWAGTSFDIDGSVFNTPDEYTIVIKATGYKDKVFEITVSDNKLDVPSYVVAKNKTIRFGNKIEIVLADYFSGTSYFSDFTGATINGEIKSKDQLRISGGFTTLLEIADMQIGKHKIVLHANGYKDKEIEVEVQGKSVPLLVKLVVNGKIISTASASTTKEGTLQIIVGDVFSTYYMPDIVKVTVNGRDLDNITYEKIELPSTFGNAKYDVISVPMDSLEDGENILSVHANGYNEKSFTVEISI